MKHTTRLLSLLLTLAMLLSMFAGLSMTASAASYRYNEGTRHEVCTSLSAQAKAYYTDSYTWDKLSTMSGSDTKSSLKSMDSELYTSLHDLMRNSLTYQCNYKGSNGLQVYWPYTDAKNGKAGTQLFYSDTTSESFNREHVWPKSRGSFYQKFAGCDLHHLRPTDSTINSTRGNMTMGDARKVSSSCSTKSYGGKTVLWYDSSRDIVEVNDNIKGDVARIMLYVYVTWEQPNLFENVASGDLPQMDPDDDANNGKKVMWDLPTLLEWMEIDPVDTWEMERNDITEDIQGNRNVFIDYPELAWMLFNEEIPTDYTTPSGYAMNSDPCDHVWSAWTVTKEANCTEAGEETRTCSVCNRTERKELPALGHLDENQDGICERCGVNLNELPSNAYTLSDAIAEGNEVIIYNAENKQALSSGAARTYYLAGVSAEATNNVITTEDETIVWTVGKDASGNWTFTQGDKVLGAVASGTFFNLKTDPNEAGIATGWKLDTCNAANKNFYLYSATLTGQYGNVYAEWYAKNSAFSAYCTSTERLTETDFGFQFYVRGTNGGDTPHTHTWDEGKITKEATCTEAGAKTFTCTCGETKTEAIPALGHVDADKDNKCDRCGISLGGSVVTGNVYTLSEALKAGDQVVIYNAGNQKALTSNVDRYYLAGADMEVTNNTITTDDTTAVWTVGQDASGNWTFTQGDKVLGVAQSGTHFNVKAEPATAGNANSWTLDTCNAENKSFYLYNATLKGNYEHIYVEWYLNTFSAYDTGAEKLNETAFGFQFYTRSNGGDTPHTHVWDEGKVTKEATCTEAGTKTFTCACGETKTETISALGHAMVTDAAVPATCTEAGLTEGSHCSRCDYKVEQKTVAALGHAWDEGKVTTEPTTFTEGVKTFTCTRCGETRTETIAKLVCSGDETCPTHQFTDIPKPDNWAHVGIDFAVENKLFNGTSSTTFTPNATMSRGMLVTVLWRMEKEPEAKGTVTFTDVENGRFYAKAVAWAAENHIVEGMGNGIFAPMNDVTREQMATFLYRYASLKGYDLSATANLAEQFSDADKVSKFAEKTMPWAVGAELIKGNSVAGEILLQPKGNATRAQVALILMRFVQGAAK